ncbi:flagellar basal body P-ring protein FlgI [Arcobacter sp. FWKO B]|nr:flagellar basal body P-ring protein FlgI [Arcobacter sp. FWKO B]QOG12382.1 flagellar basal body P-ring protein FlgI [Arcobacter sp. FWKO B]
MNKLLLLLLLTISLYGQKVKDISNIVGIRENQLIGYGLVVGLAGTGDKSQFTMQSLQNLLRNSYIKIPTSSIKSKNIAAVMVTADLPPFARQGDKIRVQVSAIGDARSIDKGALLLTQLKGVDGEVYALAQGTIVADGNNLTTGIIYDGAIVENEIDFSLKDEPYLTISLIQNSAKYADKVQQVINDHFREKIAYALDTRTIEVKRPFGISMVRFIAEIENLPIESEMKRKVIIDKHQGIIIAGEDIVINPVTISRNDFTLRIKRTELNENDWKDAALNQGVDIGDGVKIGDRPVEVNLNNALINTKKLPTVSDLMRAMKIMKLPLNEIINTIEMINDMGALNGDLEIRG